MFGDLPKRKADFESTHWSVVLQTHDFASAECRVALESLCQSYWYPLYAFVRRRVSASEEAQDLTQEFFYRLLAKNFLRDVDPSKGKFRSFLLVSLKHFLANEWQKNRTKKRGGEISRLPLEFASAESRYHSELTDDVTPEHLFDRQWAETLVGTAMKRLQEESIASGKSHTFEHLQGLIAGTERRGEYAKVAQNLNTSEGALRTAVHRYRSRFRELLREEVSRTLADPADIDDEIRSLFSAFDAPKKL